MVPLGTLEERSYLTGKPTVTNTTSILELDYPTLGPTHGFGVEKGG